MIAFASLPRTCRWGFLLVLLVGVRALAADLETEKNRISLRGNALFGVKAEFKNLGGFPRQTDIGSAVSGVDHLYDDGYNRVDASGNADGSTWFWGYQNANQLTDGNSIAMHSAVGSGNSSLKVSEDVPEGGLELVYTRELGSSSSYWWAVEF